MLWGMEVENGKLFSFFVRIKPYFAAIFLQFCYAGLYIITMVAFKEGLGQLTFVLYRHGIAAFLLTPFAFFLERKQRPKLTLSVFFKIIALGFLEPVIDQDFYFMGMKRTSATFSSAIGNIAPAVTFIIAVVLGLERLTMKKIPSQAKVVGAVVTFTGASIMAIYRGPVINISGSEGHSRTQSSVTTTNYQWMTGTMFLVTSAIGFSGFLILQALVVKEYPAKLSLSSLVCFFGMIESGVVAIAVEHNPSAWVVGWDSRLIAILYAGVLCSGIIYYLQSMVSQERGPVFTISFYPLCMVITAILGILLLSEQLHLGSLIGATIIVIGVYLVIWGKSKDITTNDNFDKGKEQNELASFNGDDEKKVQKPTDEV